MSKPTLTNSDYCRAAKRLQCEVAAIKAVASVESAGNGFYPDGFPVILFERHLFKKHTNGRYNANYPEISGPAGNYGAAGANQRRKFNIAFALDPDAAMKSCSWGKFQILGENHKVCGYATVGEFVDAMKIGEGEQLDAFVSFVIANNLTRHLRNLNWAGFAKGYNGAGYRKNRYDDKMAAAYKRFAKENIDCSSSTAGPSDSSSDQSPGNERVNNYPPPSIDSAAVSPDRTQIDPSNVQPGVDSNTGTLGTSQEQPPTAIPLASEPAIPVQTVTAEPQTESTLEKIGNKANAAYTAFGSVISGAIAWFSGTPAAIVASIMGAVVLLGVAYMILNALRAWVKDKRDRDERQQREQRAHEIQMALLDAAARKDHNTVALVPPPVEINGDGLEP